MFVCPLPTDPINSFRLKIFYLYLPARFYFILFFRSYQKSYICISRSKLFYRNPRVLSLRIRSSPFGITWTFDMNTCIWSFKAFVWNRCWTLSEIMIWSTLLCTFKLKEQGSFTKSSFDTKVFTCVQTNL